MAPNIKVVRFHSGNIERKFKYTVYLNTKDAINIRDNAIESARQTSNRLMERTLGTSGYAFKVRVYPYQVIREHALATGAGADRFSSGMAHSFGKPVGNAARVRKDQTIFEISVDTANIDLARKALTRASKKMPCSFSIQVVDNYKK